MSAALEKTTAPVAAAVEGEQDDFSLRDMFGGDVTPEPIDPAQVAANKQAEATATVSLTDQAEPDPSSSLEGTASNEDSTSEKSQGEASDESKEAEPQPAKSLSKQDREFKKLVEQRDKLKAAKRELEKEMADLKTQYAIEPEDVQVDPNAEAIFQARMSERIALSKARFLEREHGEALLAEKFTSEGSPWSEIESRAKTGDAQAQQMLTRASQAIDPFAEAYSILEEQDLFAEYGTSSLTAIIAKALASEEEAMEKRIMAKLQKPVSDIGKTPVTLGRAVGHSSTTRPEANEASVLQTMFGKA